jgi:hypothetical protein
MIEAKTKILVVKVGARLRVLEFVDVRVLAPEPAVLMVEDP